MSQKKPLLGYVLQISSKQAAPLQSRMHLATCRSIGNLLGLAEEERKTNDANFLFYSTINYIFMFSLHSSISIDDFTVVCERKGKALDSS